MPSPQIALRRKSKGVLIPTRELERKCIELRTQGKNYSQIGEALGIKPTVVGSAVRRAVGRSEALLEHEIQTMRFVQLAELDRMTALYNKLLYEPEPEIVFDKNGNAVGTAVKYDHMASKRLLEVQQRKADLLGLDAPKKINSENKTTLAIDEQLRGLFGGTTKVQIPIGIDEPKTLDVTAERISE